MSTDFISLRKDHLSYQISKAIEFDEKEQLFALRTQWVHRFGIETLQDIESKEEVLSFPVESEQELNISKENNYEKAAVLGEATSLINEVDKSENSIEASSLIEKVENPHLLSNQEQIDLFKKEESIETPVDGKKDQALPINNNEITELSKQEDMSNREEKLANTLDTNLIEFLPPPVPSLNHWRRWLGFVAESKEEVLSLPVESEQELNISKENNYEKAAVLGEATSLINEVDKSENSIEASSLIEKVENPHLLSNQEQIDLFEKEESIETPVDGKKDQALPINNNEITELSKQEDMSNREEKLANTLDTNLIEFLPPPVPSLNHLRRWVPLIEYEMPKAS